MTIMISMDLNGLIGLSTMLLVAGFIRYVCTKLEQRP
jgi:hypothetical protein